MHIDETKKFDKRTIEKNLKEGTVSDKEWRDFLKKLPDASDKADILSLEGGKKEGAIPDEGKESGSSPSKETPPEKE
jgi:hypothetical protein